MIPHAEHLPAGIAACGCITPFGGAAATVDALLAGQRSLKPTPVLGRDGGDPVPLSLIGAIDETVPPRWLGPIQQLAAEIPEGSWGTGKSPVVVTSSNFGVGDLYAYTRDKDPAHLKNGVPWSTVDFLRTTLGWGDDVCIFSHACVSAHVGLAHAGRLLSAGIADRVLVFTFDFVSPFVAGGFHSLKILNAAMPAPFARREAGAIGLGDGAAFAVLTRESTDFQIVSHALHNEMFHFTSNQPDGTGFSTAAAAAATSTAGRKVWIKGHGTGTLDAGKLEAEAFARHFPDAPLVSWKGSLGHTLGSCGLVELALTLESVRRGRTPGTVGTMGPTFTETVALDSFTNAAFDSVVLASNAFGGAHAAMILKHA